MDTGEGVGAGVVGVSMGEMETEASSEAGATTTTESVMTPLSPRDSCVEEASLSIASSR